MLRPRWAIIFLLLPLLELYLLVKIAQVIGAAATVGLVVFTAVLGALLLRHQGLATLDSVRKTMQRGEAPAQPLLEGLMVLLGSVCLMIPGPITDVVGALALVPPVRRWLVSRFFHRFGPPGGRPPGQGPHVIDGEYERDD